jgi:hypothetical protein
MQPLATQIRSAFVIRDVINRFEEHRHDDAMGHMVANTKAFGYSPGKNEVCCATYIPNRIFQFTGLNAQVLDGLQRIADDFPKPYRFGIFEQNFHLSITRPGCEFDGDISQRSYGFINLLKDWFEHAAVSGYGDMKASETKVDPTVRDARDIPATQFTVTSDLLERIRETWSKNFIPKEVRVEPYKIHLYRTGGHFKSHRDTPEAGLVGTFLLGLGDTSDHWSYEKGMHVGAFCIGDEELAARPCSWVAFYPDVPHSVSKLDLGHRATIAFKIFYEGNTAKEEEEFHKAIEARFQAAISTIPLPFGVLFEHMYHMQVAQLSGLDALLFSAAQQVQNAAVHLLPVVVVSHSSVYYDEDAKYEQDVEDEYETWVFPLTAAHVDYFSSGERNEEAKAKIELFENIKEVPFYSWNFNKSALRWQRDSQEINYTGNEADGTNEKGIYVAHALLLLRSDS